MIRLDEVIIISFLEKQTNKLISMIGKTNYHSAAKYTELNCKVFYFSLHLRLCLGL